MANLNAPFGFKKIGGVGSVESDAMNPYLIASGLAETIACGDVVKSDGVGGIQKAGATDVPLGIFKGVEYTATDGSYNFKKVWASGTTLKSGTTAKALVDDNPLSIFMVQSSQTINQTDLGTFCNLVDGTPDAATGASRQTVGATGGAIFRIEKILVVPQRSVDANNNTSGYTESGVGQYAVLHVKFVKHERAGSVMAVAS